MNYARHARRRRRFARKLGDGCLALIPGATEQLRNDDVHYPFRQDSDFLYLTGFSEPDALLIIVGGKVHRSIIFSLPKDELAELWSGERIGQEKARTQFGIDEAYAFEPQETLRALIMRHLSGNTQTEMLIKKMRMHGEQKEVVESLIMRLLTECTTLSYPMNRLASIERFIVGHESKMKRRLPTIDAHRIIGEMRLIKDTSEMATMKRAGEISATAHHDILRFVKPGRYEYEVEAELTRAFRSAGGDPLHAYPPIVAGGKNACTLHYVRNNALLQGGDLLLIDAGCELDSYASDITRTIPISGLWTQPQRTLYEIVLHAQVEAIKCARVGTPLSHLGDVARLHIVSGLLRIGLVKAKDEEDALLRKLDEEFFPHGTSHWLGLDVHDSGDYQKDAVTKKAARRLEAGMVITVEPGIYVRPSPHIPSQYWNIGIRIEDDVLIAKDGPVILSHRAPKDPDAIESIMQCGMI